MDDYSALAHRVAGAVADVRGCLILSRDGLVLGSYPEDDGAVKPAWLKFSVLGDPERSFVEHSDQVWAYVRRGPFAAFAIAAPGIRPGLLIDQLEQMLFAAEEARVKRDGIRVPDAPAAPSGRPRTSLHPPADAPATVDVRTRPSAETAAKSETRPWARGRMTAADTPPVDETATASADASTSAQDGPKKAKPPESAEAAAPPAPKDPVDAKSHDEVDGETEVVDPVLLAKEFSGLLQVEEGGDEGSS